jgi:hypothetical protein
VEVFGLWDVMIVQPDIALERGFQILGADEAVGVEHLGNTAIEALDHAVCLRASGGREAVLNPQRFTQLVKLMRTGCVSRPASKQAIGEFNTRRLIKSA